MDKDEAIRVAREETARTGAMQAVWLIGPGQYITTILKPGDRGREGFLGVVLADGTYKEAD